MPSDYLTDYSKIPPRKKNTEVKVGEEMRIFTLVYIEYEFPTCVHYFVVNNIVWDEHSL